MRTYYRLMVTSSINVSGMIEHQNLEIPESQIPEFVQMPRKRLVSALSRFTFRQQPSKAIRVPAFFALFNIVGRSSSLYHLMII